MLKTGSVQAGDPVTVERYTGATITVLEMFRDYYDNALSAATLRRHLAAPLAARARADDEAKLAKRLG